MNCKSIVDMLNLYHLEAHPEDGGPDRKGWPNWFISFSPVMSADQYIMLIKYRRPPREGDLYSKRTYDGLELYRKPEWHRDEMLRDDFDQMRVEIIETLDGLIKPKPKPFWKGNWEFGGVPEFYEWKPKELDVVQFNQLNKKSQLYYEGLIA